MRRSRFFMPLLAIGLFAASTLSAPAQDLVAKINASLEGQPDALELLRASAATAQRAQQLSATIVNSVKIVAGENENNQQQAFDVKLSRPNLYSLTMIKPTEDFWVRSDGRQTMTYLAPLGRYSLTDEQAGISDFARSRLAKMLGNGVGGLVFGLLDTESAEKVIESVTESSYIGEETIDEQALHHCRYSSGDMQWDAWFTPGAGTMVKRVSPDLSAMAARAPAAQQFDNFSIEINFDFKDVDTNTAIAANAFTLTAPEGAEQVDDLFAPPPQPPHQLLGKKAPLFDSLDLTGEPIDLGGLVGKKIIILDFWATWCGPCVAAMPKINKVANDYAEKGVQLYAVNQGEDADTITEFLTNQELDVPVAMDPDSEAGGMYQVEGIPTSVIIGLGGRVQVVHVGFSGSLEESLREELDALLAGKNLAAETIAEWNEKHPNKAIEVEQ